VWSAGHSVDIATKAGTTPGRVLVGSDLQADHVDVTLIAFDDATIAETDLIPPSPEANVAQPLSLDETIQAIGNSTTDGLDLLFDQWAIDEVDSGDALALHLSYTLNLANGRSVVLRNVVEGKGTVGMFVPGCSGATWASFTDQIPRPLAFTSHGDSQLGLGTHFADSLQWLVKNGVPSRLQVAWAANQWWPV
jgi:hypothetical protein